MNKQKCVYLITNILNNKKYIGVAEDFDKRMYQHKIGHDKEHSYIDRSILKYGWNNFSIEIIDNYTDSENRKQLEQYYIKKLHTHRSEDGYNLTWGGDDVSFPNTKGEKNPRAELTEKDIIDIRNRRMNGERLSDVYEIYKNRISGDKRAGFSKIWLHESWIDICSDFKGKYPINTKHYSTIRRNILTESDKQYLIKFFKWYGPIKYSEVYKTFKTLIDWQSFQEICKQIVDELYGNKNTRKYRNKIGETQKRIDNFRKELIIEPIYKKS